MPWSTSTPKVPGPPPNTCNLSKDSTLLSSPEDSISSVSWSPKADYLAVGSWDSKVRIYDMTQNTAGEGRAMIDFNGPVLTCDWSEDGTKVAGAGADKTARILDISASGTVTQQVAAHDAPIRSLRFFAPPNMNASMVITGSWDKTIKYWDLRTPNPVATIDCKERVYCLDAKKDLLVIGTAERLIHIIDLKDPMRILETRESPLKYQTRAVTCSNEGKAFAVGSIEGRIGYQMAGVNESAHNDNFSFRCHRTPPVNNISEVYAINDISVHPVHGTYSSAGSDGHFTFWDMENKVRLKGSPNVGGPLTATAFSYDGKKFAYAVGYDWSKGFAHNTTGLVNKLMVHAVEDMDCRPKPNMKANGTTY